MYAYIELQKENNYYKIINPLQVLWFEGSPQVTIGLYKDRNYICRFFNSFASDSGDDRFYFKIYTDGSLASEITRDLKDISLFSARKIKPDDPNSEWVMEKCNLLEDNPQCYYYTYENREDRILEISKPTTKRKYLAFYEIDSHQINK